MLNNQGGPHTHTHTHVINNMYNHNNHNNNIIDNISVKCMRSVSVHTLIQLRLRIAENLILVTEDVIVDVEFVCHRTLAEEKKQQTSMNT